MAAEWNPDVCNDKSGFLFSHECFRPATAQCALCGRPICEDHARDVDGQMLCITCAKKAPQQNPVDPADPTTTSRPRDTYDPYFYGGAYYHGWGYYGHSRPMFGSSPSASAAAGHDPHDFTEADSESLQHEADADFEHDMSES